MYLVKCERFISALNSVIDIPGCYLNLNENKFETTTDKTKKNLNTEKIVELATDLLNNLEDSEYLKNDRIHALRSSLKAYVKRLNQSKPWYAKVGKWLGIAGSSEQKLRDLVARLDDQCKFTSNKEPTLFEENQETAPILVNYYHKILGSTSFESEILEGQGLVNCYISLLVDLMDFRLYYKPDTEEERLVCRAFYELEFALHILISNYNLRDSKLSENSQDSLKEIIKIILDRLDTLPFSNDPSKKDIPFQDLILPGGYLVKDFNEDLLDPDLSGHHIIYKIERKDEDNFSLTVVNSGEGSLESLEFVLNKIPLVRRFREFQNKVKKLLPEEKEAMHDLLSKEEEGLMNEWSEFLQHTEYDKKIYDVVYTNLTTRNLSQLFFEKILSFLTGFKRPLSMDRLLQLLESHLFNETCSNVTQSVKKHKLKNKGVCVAHPLLIWLHQLMGDRLYLQFKVHMAKRESEKLRRLTRNSSYEQFIKSFARVAGPDKASMCRDKLSSSQYLELLHEMEQAGSALRVNWQTKNLLIRD